MTICSTQPSAPVPEGFRHVSLREYIEHKTGESVEATAADSPERFLVIESEALRDLAVMSEITGEDVFVTLLPGTESNPACKQLLEDHCRTI